MCSANAYGTTEHFSKNNATFVEHSFRVGIFMIYAILVDDEPRARRSLRILLQQHYAEQITIVAEANNAEEARAAILQHAPDVVFLDIHMPGEDGLQLIASIHPQHRSFLTVFVTAYSQYVLRAMRERALDYLTKPIDLDEFHATIGKLQGEIHEHRKLQLLHNDKIESLLHRLLQDGEQDDPPTHIALHTHRTTQQMVEIASITHCRSERNYCSIFLEHGKEILTSKPLAEYEPLLIRCGFLRVHRSYIVSLAHINSYAFPSDTRTGGVVVLNNGTKIEVARRKRRELLTKLQGSTLTREHDNT